MNEVDKRSKPQIGIQSVDVGMHLLKTLMGFGRPVMLKELAAAAGMPPAKAHRYLVSLTRSGMVSQSGSGGRYGLGEFALNIGLSALSQLNVVRIASDAVSELRDRTDQTCFLAVWGSHGPTIVRWSEGSRPVPTTARVGYVLSLVGSATGRIFSAFLPRERTAEAIAADLEGRGMKEFDKTLAAVRERGVAGTEGEEQATINALSAPLFDHSGELVGALTMLGPARSFDVSWDGPLAQQLKEMSEQVCRRLGHTGA
jgi:DNA-binding IclR family transcriptional regulator